MPALSLLIKPASGLCNLRCKYCFYADEMIHRELASYGVMTIDTLHLILEKAFADAQGQLNLAFQGGEPTLAGLDFFREVVASVQRLNTRKIQVNYAIQTNGMVLDEQWAAFFAENNFLVGISLDGIQPIHDQNRVDINGQGTFNRVMEKVALLKAYHVEFNILTVITSQTAGSIGKIYRFFQRHDLPWQQYIPCLDPLETERGQENYSLTPAKYAHFLKVLFDNWYRDVKANKFTYNRYFENLVGMLAGIVPESCGMSGRCSVQNVVESDGSIYPCDFYVLDSYRLGNLRTDSFDEIDKARNALRFVEKSFKVEERCLKCKWGFLCRGGCRRDRERLDGSLGLNYFCEAYADFFEYSYPRLAELADGVRARCNN